MARFVTIWRNAQAETQRGKRRNQWKPVRVLGLDGAHVLGWGEKHPVLVAVDLGTGEPLTVGYINEYDPQTIAWASFCTTPITLYHRTTARFTPAAEP